MPLEMRVHYFSTTKPVYNTNIFICKQETIIAPNSLVDQWLRFKVLKPFPLRVPSLRLHPKTIISLYN